MYPGGKNHCYQQIINRILPHDVYIETHLGSGAIMRNKRPAARLNMGIEIDRAVLAETACRIVGDSDDCRQSSPDVTMLQLDHTAKSNGTAVTPFPTIAADSGGAVWRFVWGRAENILKMHNFTGNEFVYADPPYVMGARRSQRPIYNFEYTDEDHQRLLEILLALPCPVMISGYWSEMYADMLAGWHTATFQAQTRGGGTATEWLWMNYPQPVALHDYRYLGQNFRERERIKRKAARWVKRFNGLPTLERQAILAELKSAGVY